MKRIARVLTARDYKDDDSYEMFQASIELAKLDALGDYITLVLEDVRDAMKSEDPAASLTKLEADLKKDMTDVNKKTKETRPKAEQELQKIKDTNKQKAEDKEKLDKEPIAASSRLAHVRKLIEAASRLVTKE